VTSTAIVWFRRDLRLSDHPALLRALEGHDEVVPAFVLDPALWRTAGPPRRVFLAGCLDELNAATGGALVVRHGRPEREMPRLVAEVGASAVYVTGESTPYGRHRDAAVESGLKGCPLVREGSSYAVEPGAVTTGEGSPYRVFTPFYRAWRAHGWAAPERKPPDPLPWASGVASDPRPPVSAAGTGTDIPAPGERAARRRLDRFLADRVDGYDDHRDLPAVDGTSRLSAYLRFGCLHPRQVLARLGRGAGAEAFRRQVAWREFYGHVLAGWPESGWWSFRDDLAGMRLDEGAEADEAFRCWAEGRTGYPIVDAGMRQLAATGWVHNRVRLLVASFLVKDLHIDWTRGARHFLDHLVDGDLASNNHGWQWVAGTGTDAAPYHRVFNPVTQGRRFDPEGAYIRRWVPELTALAAGDIHEPWRRPGGPPSGYPPPIVDHAEERAEALRRYGEARR
jgi:deoxyribodipyrimidine photo-lyase